MANLEETDPKECWKIAWSTVRGGGSMTWAEIHIPNFLLIAFKIKKQIEKSWIEDNPNWGIN